MNPTDRPPKSWQLATGLTSSGLRARSAKDETLFGLRSNSVGECELHFNKCGFLSGQAEEFFSRGQAPALCFQSFSLRCFHLFLILPRFQFSVVIYKPTFARINNSLRRLCVSSQIRLRSQPSGLIQPEGSLPPQKIFQHITRL